MQKWFEKRFTKYPRTMGHHILYLGPPGNIAQNVLERVTECIKQNGHKKNFFCSFVKLMNLFIFYPFFHDRKECNITKSKIR
jgi:hypothetical protein